MVFLWIQYRNYPASFWIICTSLFPLLIRFFLSSQALSLKEAEKTVLSDRVTSLQAELSAAALEAERMSREAAHYKEQEQVPFLLLMNYLQSCVTEYKIIRKEKNKKDELNRLSVLFSLDQSRGSDYRAAGASLSAGGCGLCS